jgi:hypothetical protein
VSADSIWSGIINKEQVTELNSAYLSHLAIPYEDRLFLLYNSYFRNEEQYGSTTILDKKEILWMKGASCSGSFEYFALPTRPANFCQRSNDTVHA